MARARPRDARQRPGARTADEDPARVQLLRRLRPRDPAQEPGRAGPVTDGGPDVRHRWVGSGWTIFNNKGKPVRQYEPFFTAHTGFEFARASGSARCSSTTRPGGSSPPCTRTHSYDKTVFDPWHQDIWDANDTVLLDPRDDPDVGGYAGRYLAVLGEPAGRLGDLVRAAIGGAWAGPQRRAAEQTARARGHARPGAWLDTLGRTFLTVAHNRSARTAGWPTSTAGPAACWTSRATSARCATRSAARSCATATRCWAGRSPRPAWTPAAARLLPDVMGKPVYA